MTDPVVSDPSVDALLAALTGVIASAASPEAQQAQVLPLQRLALEGSVIPSRIPAPLNITEVGGYINLLTGLGENDLRGQMLSSALGVAGTVPLPALTPIQPPLTLTPVANDQPPGSTGVSSSVVLRSDLAAGLVAAQQAVHAAGGLLPLWSPAALPAAGSAVVLDPLVYLGRAVLVAPTATMVDPQTDAVVEGRPVSAPGPGFQLGIRAAAGTTGASVEDWICLEWDDIGSAFVETTLSGATVLPIETALAGSGLTAVRPTVAPSGRDDLTWARLAVVDGLLPGITRLGDELALVYAPDRIGLSALAPMSAWTWNGTAFAP